ncbi:MAG: hypothetical protein ACREDU_09705, partial [Methylocella sp.]
KKETINRLFAVIFGAIGFRVRRWRKMIMGAVLIAAALELISAPLDTEASRLEPGSRSLFFLVVVLASLTSARAGRSMASLRNRKCPLETD